MRLAGQLSPASPSRPQETRVLMAEPTYFQVDYVNNPFMSEHLGAVRTDVAWGQWESLRDVYRRLGFQVHTLPGVPGLPDLVFMANQSFPVLTPEGETRALLSRMHASERRKEVEHVAEWYAEQGIATTPLDGGIFEGMGDCLWVPGQHRIFAGYGHRTERRAVEALSRCMDAFVAPLHLIHPHFYHLDTCLSPIDENRAFFVREAFDEDSLKRLQNQFKTMIPVPLDEALGLLACNGHCPDGKHFIVQKGAVKTNALAQEQGLTVVEVETSEFLKSGGSVYCMKLMLP